MWFDNNDDAYSASTMNTNDFQQQFTENNQTFSGQNSQIICHEKTINILDSRLGLYALFIFRIYPR